MPCQSPAIYLVSACLVGLKTRYDGQIQKNAACMAQLSGAVWIPICPEQLGGLPTPRIAADLIGGDGDDVLAGRAEVVGKDGLHVTESFMRGAQQVLAIALAQPINGILVKAKSPSCGLTPCKGVTAALLLKHGFTVTEF